MNEKGLKDIQIEVWEASWTHLSGLEKEVPAVYKDLGILGVWNGMFYLLLDETAISSSGLSPITGVAVPLPNSGE